MTQNKTAIVLGGSGSVGMALLAELFRDESFDAVIALLRRSVPEAVTRARAAGTQYREELIPEMTPETLRARTLEAAQAVEGELVGFSVLGIGAGTRKLTLDEHRAVDVRLNEAFAGALRDSGRVHHLAFMSAVGADPTASAEGNGAAGMPRYARVKGESEEAVRKSGPEVVSIFRPATILGSKHTPVWLGKALGLIAFMTPGKYQSVRTDQIARAMIAVTKRRPAHSAIYHYPEMMELIGGS